MSGRGRVRGGRRSVVAGLVVVLVTGGVVATVAALRPRPAEEREVVASAVVGALNVSVVVRDVHLQATQAIADFGVGKAVRLVRVRIVDGMTIEIQLTTPTEILLAAPPRFCLVGPFAAPDDAGLTDRCWGEPDLTAAVSSAFEHDNAGHVVIRRDAAPLAVALRRGDVSCDFPPGPWHLEVTLNPVIDGTAAAERHLPDVAFDVPWAPSDMLTLVKRSRYCGLANYPYESQGEPGISGGG